MNDRRSLDGAFKAIERLSAIGVLLTSVEMLSKSKHFNDTSLMRLQSCLSYITAGVAKAFGSMWYDGTAMTGILGTNSYGNRTVGQFLQKHPKLAAWSGKGVTFWESVFPVVLILPRPISDLVVRRLIYLRLLFKKRMSKEQ